MKKHVFSTRSLVTYIVSVAILVILKILVEWNLPDLKYLLIVTNFVFSTTVIPLSIFLFQKDVEQYLSKEIEEYKATLGLKEKDTRHSIEVRDLSWEKFQTVYRDLESFLQTLNLGATSHAEIYDAKKKLFSQINQAFGEFYSYFSANNTYLPESLKSKFQQNTESLNKVLKLITFYYLGLEPLNPAYVEFENTKAQKADLEKMIRNAIHLLEI